MIRRLTVAGLLRRAFAALVMLILLSGTTGMAVSMLQHENLRRLAGHIMPLRVANSHLRAVLVDAQGSLRGYLLTGEVRFLAGYLDQAAEFGPSVVRMRELAVEDTERAAIEKQVSLAAVWWSHADRLRYAPPRSEEAARRVAEGRALAEPFLAANTALDRDLEREDRGAGSRSVRLGSATLLSQILLTGLAMLIAAVTAVRATRRITRPLDKLVTVLDRLGGGDHVARAPPETDLVEVAAVTNAVNALADEAERIRARDAEASRLASAVRMQGIQIRQHLSVKGVLDEAVAGLGPMLGADHVVVRLLGGDGEKDTGVGWSRPASPGAEPSVGPEATGRRPSGESAGIQGAEPPAGVAVTDALAGLSPGWLVGASGGHLHVWNDLAEAGPELPAEERTALLAAGARAVLTVGFLGATGPSGAVTLIRCTPGAGWSPEEVRAAEYVASDLGRGLLHATLYERELELVARLRDLDNAKTDFMSTVSHELRTPLTSIAGYVEMLADGDAGELAPAQRRMLDVIERNTTRLQVLIEDLLVLSRIEAGALRTSRREVEYGWLITAAVAAIAPAAAVAGVTVETDVGRALAGHADPGQMDRVLMNLLTNAVKFSPRGGVVRISAARDGDDVVIRVSDTGMGIPEAEQQHLFTRFFRASNAVERAVPGTGLGLAIVRTIVVRHGGDVSVRSREGEGTTVTVRLPP